MAGAATVLSDESWLSRLDRSLVTLERFLGLLSGLAVFSLMFLAAYSVAGRKFFGSPMPGYVDWIEVLLPLMAVMGIAYVQRDGGHIRMDILIGRLQGRALWAAELLSVLLIFGLILMLLWGSWAHFDRSFDMSRPMWSRDSTIDIGLPVWPSKLIVPVAFAVLCLRLLIQIWGYGRALVLGLETPVAVPLTMTVEEQARAEAAQLEGRD
ncbi:TRAP transporter small permease [Roseovarius faecimaris]|uniref:TRAP transporter small permease protein n=1 Tax=Roseovarius faecimaris TaxID=2494550 RepID=A0A6I6IRX9_9RHOB|nr:TRAP transporter small permease [Roseovarius faecimaris]QGX99819.1 TRAP transporter small permease [Roseovarius faecimaris]